MPHQAGQNHRESKKQTPMNGEACGAVRAAAAKDCAHFILFFAVLRD